MWDRSSSRRPIASFQLPPHPPDQVQAAYDEFDRVATEWGGILGEIDDARDEAKRAKTAAKEAVTEAAIAGKATKVSIVGVEQDHLARVAELQAKADAVALAVDEHGNRLAAAIAAHRDPWLENLGAAEDTAAVRFTAAVAEARAALRDLAPARGAVHWLADFDPGEATVGRQAAFVGGRVSIDTTTIPRESSTPAGPVLDLLDQVTAPAEPPRPRRHTVTTR
jgi:hypothetical protein